MLFRLNGFFAAMFVLSASQALAAAPTIPSGVPKDEAYQKEFAKCDDKHIKTFYGLHFDYFEPRPGLPDKHWYGCDGDQSGFERFEKIEKDGDKPAAIIVQSKIANDTDGSSHACGPHALKIENCENGIMMRPSKLDPKNCPVKEQGKKYCKPVDPDIVPFVVMPGSGPKVVPAGVPIVDARQFERETNLSLRDYGVVIYKGNVVPVIIGDTGPWNKIGEGSTVLLSRLNGGKPIDKGGAVTILFPGSGADIDKLSPDTLACVVQNEGMSRYEKLVGLPPSKPLECRP